MNGLLQKTALRLERLRGKKLLIGVSGGRDSMCLLHCVINCGAADKNDITVAHVNHRLREQADSDERFVRDYCERNGVRFRAYRVDVKAESAKFGLTIEQAARNLRYDVFYDLVSRGEADFILTAHHALDNAETALMHLFRGAGLDGLRGMSDGSGMLAETAKNGADIIIDGSDFGRIYDGARTGALPVIRPFIDAYPSELDEYCRQNGLNYVIDETNLIDDADRNFIRLNVIPLIEQRYKGATRAINAFAAECAGACDILDKSMDLSAITYDNGAVLIADGALASETAARYVRRALGFFSVIDVTREQIERAVALAHMRIGASVEFSSGIVAVREYGCIALFVPRRKCDSVCPLVFGANYIDGLAVDVTESDEAPKEVKGGAADADKLVGAVLRFRRDGDVFTPYGGKRKKLKQYFIDKKIPKRLRDRIPLICRDDEVLVVAGVEISESVKQTEETARKAVVRIRR